MFSSLISKIKVSWLPQRTTPSSSSSSIPKQTDVSAKLRKAYLLDFGRRSFSKKDDNSRSSCGKTGTVVSPLYTDSPVFLGTDIDHPPVGETDIDQVCAPVKPKSNSPWIKRPLEGGIDLELADLSYCKSSSENSIDLKSYETTLKFTSISTTNSRKSPSRSCGDYFPKDLTHISIRRLSVAEVVIRRSQEREILGRGTYGTVYKARLKDTGQPVVVKKISLNRMSSSDVFLEARIMTHLSDTKIVPRLHGIVEYSKASFCLVEEFCAGGLTLKQLVSESFFSFTKRQLLTICYEMTLGLLAIHERNVLHNDIKPDNVLVDTTTKQLQVYFIDFGLSTYRRSCRSEMSPNFLRSYHYIAPEVRRCYPTSHASDIYSLGFIFRYISERGLADLRPLANQCMLEEARRRPGTVVVAMALEDLLAECDDWGDLDEVT